MIGNQKDEYISTAPDEIIFREAAKRLRQMHFRDHGTPMEFGSFEFIFEKGRFVCVEQCQRRLCYRAPLWPRPVPIS
jgi:hypothetical protein